MPCYVLDADALINLHRHFPQVFRKLRKWVANGITRIPEGVYRELRKKSDRVGNHVEKWKSRHTDFVVRISSREDLKEEFSRIEQGYGEKIRVGKQEYPGFWKSRAGRKAADGQTVAVAKVLNCTAVSDDRAVKMACLLERVPCIPWSEFVRQLGSGTQLSLNLDE